MKEPLTNPEAVLARIQKFSRRAKDIIDVDHLILIMASFPEPQRTSIYETVRPMLGFNAPDYAKIKKRVNSVY